MGKRGKVAAVAATGVAAAAGITTVFAYNPSTAPCTKDQAHVNFWVAEQNSTLYQKWAAANRIESANILNYRDHPTTPRPLALTPFGDALVNEIDLYKLSVGIS